jgi:hypothetical protein
MEAGSLVGNFYVNFSVKDAEQKQVADTLERGRRRAIVAPAEGGYVVAYDEEAESQSTRSILAVGRLLSGEMSRPVLATLNHDDDILCYWLFEGGELVDSYNSNPDAFEEEAGAPPWQAGDPKKLCTSLRPRADAAAVEEILRGEYLFAVERHERLAKTLGLPSWSVGYGYSYVADGELEEELDVNRLIQVGGRAV